jgi:hypothetical protein
VPYLPRNPPSISNLEDLRLWVESEFESIARALNDTIVIQLQPVFRDVVKPRDGMLVYADGVSFNPGAGAGVYERRGGAWHKL